MATAAASPSTSGCCQAERISSSVAPVCSGASTAGAGMGCALNASLMLCRLGLMVVGGARAVAQAEPLPDPHSAALALPGRQLEDCAGARAARPAPGPEPRRHSDDSHVAVDKHRVDREAHEKGVDRR